MANIRHSSAVTSIVRVLCEVDAAIDGERAEPITTRLGLKLLFDQKRRQAANVAVSSGAKGRRFDSCRGHSFTLPSAGATRDRALARPSR